MLSIDEQATWLVTDKWGAARDGLVVAEHLAVVSIAYTFF
jgi:hypothetical protein